MLVNFALILTTRQLYFVFIVSDALLVSVLLILSNVILEASIYEGIVDCRIVEHTI